MTMREPASSFTPYPSLVLFSSPPGAQAASQLASSRLPNSPDSPVPPKQVQTSPAAALSLASASATESGGFVNRITWGTTLGWRGSTLLQVIQTSWPPRG